MFATVGSPEKAELARAAGADHVVEYRTEDFAGAIEAIAGPHPLDVVYDGVGRATFARGLDLLRRRGTMGLRAWSRLLWRLLRSATKVW